MIFLIQGLIGSMRQNDEDPGEKSIVLDPAGK